MGKIALITVHGMGDTETDYYRHLQDGVARRLDDQWDDVIFESIYFQDELQTHQKEVFDRMRPEIDWMKFRKFLLYGFSDAASLEHRKQDPESAYTRVQQVIRTALDNIYVAAGNEAVPVMIVAESLGCQVISNYVWDAGATNPYAGVWIDPEPTTPEHDAFRRLHTMQRFMTVGCNIPIFVAGHHKIVPFTPKDPSFEWFNYYDEDDVLGWPLRPLAEPDDDGHSYASLVTDVPINVGGGLLGTLGASWNPLSHTHYRKDADVHKAVAKEIRTMLAA